jgi:hypothetical protein
MVGNTQATNLHRMATLRRVLDGPPKRQAAGVSPTDPMSRDAITNNIAPLLSPVRTLRHA